MRMVGIRAALIAASMFSCAAAQAAVVVDQDALVSPSGAQAQPATVVLGDIGVGALSGTTRNFLQTFTAGKTGTLDRVELQIGAQPNSSGFLLFLFWDGNILNSLGSSLPSKFIFSLPTVDQAFNQAGFAVADYSGDAVSMTAGSEYSFIAAYVPFMFGSEAGAIIGQTADANTPAVYNAYAGGTAIINFSDPSLGFTNAPGALGFRTYVNQSTAAVPEPATWAMMILGFGVLGTAMRRQRRYRLSGTFG